MRAVSRSGVPSAGMDTPTMAELFIATLISRKVMVWSPTLAITSESMTLASACASGSGTVALPAA